MQPAPTRVLGSALLLLGLAGPATASAATVNSPDGQLQLSVVTDDIGQLRFAVKRDGKTLVEPSKLGITLDGRDLGFGARIGTPAIEKSTYAFPVIGGHAQAKGEFTQAVLPIQSGQPAVKWELQVRVFNGAVAYRYRVPGNGKRRVAGESSEWRLPQGSKVWYQNYTRGKDYEGIYQSTERRGLVPGSLIGAPTLLQLPENAGYALVTEANLVDYTDMGLMPLSDTAFKATLHNDASGFELTGEIVTPWRVTLLAKDLGELVNTDVLQALCPPPSPELANADWIQPGRAAWHWRVTGAPKFDQQRQWVDSAAALGFEYYLVDDGWRDWKQEGRDAWAMLKDVVDYARSKNVKIIAWVHSNEVTKADERLAYFKKTRDIGVVGLKIDFMRPANVWWTQWYEETLRDAAKFKLMINYHGALKPTGRERTWPNEVTREGIGGREQGKLPGTHDTTLPFLRLVQGHGDYTPTEFRAKDLGGNTVAKELAQAIVYTSPLLCYSGDPKDYLASPAVDVIKAIPSTWDETIVLPGSQVGEVAGFARRKGNDWYIGIINGSTPRTMPINLSFLKNGSYAATLLGDTDGQPATFDKQDKTVTASDTLQAKLSKDGGYVAMFKAKN